MKAFICADIGKDRFHCGHAVAVNRFTIAAINPSFHPVRCASPRVIGKGYDAPVALAVISGFRISHTGLFGGAGATISQLTFEKYLDFPVVGGCFSVDPHLLAFRAMAGFVFLIKVKLIGGDYCFDALNSVSMTLAILVFLLGEQLIS